LESYSLINIVYIVCLGEWWRYVHGWPTKRREV